MPNRPPRDPATKALLVDLKRRRAQRRRLQLVGLVAVVLVILSAIVFVSAVARPKVLVSQSTAPQGSLGSIAGGGASPSGPARPAATSASSATSPPTSREPTTTTRAPTTTTVPAKPASFDGGRAMEHVRRLAAEIGVRKGGTEGEKRAADYAARFLNSQGYGAEVVEVDRPDGVATRNVVATLSGRSNDIVVIGAHMDSKAPAPGGNDNASGSATVLELARDFRGTNPAATLQFVLFGNEEMIDSNGDHHHYGSRGFVNGMTPEHKANVVGMISVDMVAYGDTFVVRTMDQGPRKLEALLRDFAQGNGVRLSYLQDTSSYGYSDHEPFERAGIPVAWLEWRDDPTYHTAEDTAAHCDQALLQKTGALLQGFLAGLDQTTIASLRESRG